MAMFSTDRRLGTHAPAVLRAAIAVFALAAAATAIAGEPTSSDSGRLLLAQAPVYSNELPPPADPYAPGQRYEAPGRGDDAYRPQQRQGGYDTYSPQQPRGGADDAYRPARRQGGYEDSYRAPQNAPETDDPDSYRRSGPVARDDGQDYRRENHSRYDDRGGLQPYSGPRQYSENEIINAGHGFFGSVSEGLARAIERLFRSQGRPNGYILGEDAGGAFVAGLRYGEGRLYTKDAGVHKVFWQGPSVGYDFGGEGSKTMVLVYNLRDPSDIYKRYGGVQGSAYLVGGVSVQLQKNEHVTLAPIRSGIGLRLGANVGYLKYTRSPTWNPF